MNGKKISSLLTCVAMVYGCAGKGGEVKVGIEEARVLNEKGELNSEMPEVKACINKHKRVYNQELCAIQKLGKLENGEFYIDQLNDWNDIYVSYTYDLEVHRDEVLREYDGFKSNQCKHLYNEMNSRREVFCDNAMVDMYLALKEEDIGKSLSENAEFYVDEDFKFNIFAYFYMLDKVMQAME